MELLVGFLGLLDVIWGHFLGSLRNSPFRAFSAKSEALSISAKKLNLLGLMGRGEAVLLGEKLKRASSLSLNYAWGSLVLWIWYAFLP